MLKAAKKLELKRGIKIHIRGIGLMESYILGLINKYQNSNVRFSSEFLSKSDLSEFMSQADVFVLPMKGSKSADLGLPTKIFEYLSYGTPIICASNGESAKFIFNSKSGIIIPIGDHNAMSDAILKLFYDKCSFS